MADYRDPKVTSGTKRDGGMGKWVGIAIAALVLLLLIAWFVGAFDGAEEVEPEVVAPVTEEPATVVEPETEEPATVPAAPVQ